MKVRDVMTAPAITVGPGATYGEVLHCLLQNDISGVPVVDESGGLVGMVTEADLMPTGGSGEGRRALGLVGEMIHGHRSSWVPAITGRAAHELMSRDTIVAGLDEDVEVAGRRMLRTGCKRLPVVQHGKVVGVVSRQDTLRRFDRADREISIDVAGLLTGSEELGESGEVASTVSHGIVTLSGHAPSVERARALADAAFRIDGVIEVDDQIVVNGVNGVQMS